MDKKTYSLDRTNISNFISLSQSSRSNNLENSEKGKSDFGTESITIPHGNSLDDLSMMTTSMDGLSTYAKIDDVQSGMSQCFQEKTCSKMAWEGIPHSPNPTFTPLSPELSISMSDQDHIYNEIDIDSYSMNQTAPSPTFFDHQLDATFSCKAISPKDQNKISTVQKPSCCDVTVLTDDGGYLLPCHRERKKEETHTGQGRDCNVSQLALLRVQGLTKRVSCDVVEHFFEDVWRSGGGKIENMEYIPEKEEAVIKFLEEDSLDGVLAKGPNFVVNGVMLTVDRYTPPELLPLENYTPSEPPPVEIYTPPELLLPLENYTPTEPLPVEPLKLFISGMKDLTTDECLSNFLESKSETLPANIEYRANRRIALVTFDEEPNFEKLCHECRTTTLEGNTLTVTKVVITNCVKVTGIEPESQKEMLLHYFENHLRSGGGPVDRIVDDLDQGCYLIYFKNIEDAVIVSNADRTHVVDGLTLSVSLYHDCPEGASGVVSPFCLPEPVIMADVSLEIVHFLKTSLPNRKLFEDNLKKCHAEISWPQNQDTDSIMFICTITSDDENAKQLVVEWPDQVTSAARKHFTSLNQIELSTVKEAWSEVLNKLQSVNIRHPDGVQVITKKQVCTINIVGRKHIVDKLHVEVSKIIQETEHQIMQLETKVTKTWQLKKFQVVLLRAMKFTRDIEQKFPDIKITIELDNGEVSICAIPKDIEIIQIKMLQLLNSFASKKMELSKDICDLLFVNETRDYVQKKMMNSSLIGTWEVVRGEQGIKLYGRSDAEVKLAIEIMTQSIKEGVIRIPKKCQDAFKSADWTHLTNKIVTNNSGHIYIISRKGSVFYVATDDIFSDIHKEITSFLTLHVIVEELIPLPKGKIRFLKAYRNIDLKNIESSLEKMNVCIKVADSGNGIVVNGNKDGIKLARMKIADLANSICSQEHFLSKPGISNFFSIAKGLDMIKFVETKECCIIETKMTEVISHKPVHKAEYIFQHGRKIVVVEGDMTQLEVDVITNAANNEMNHHGGLAKSIVDMAGPEVQKHCAAYVKAKGNVLDGHVISSGPGKLSCKMIIHAVGPRWTGGQKGEQKLLQQAVENTLKFTADKKFNSVAIPALSTGKFKYPMKPATQTIVDSIQRYWFLEGHNQTSVTVVYLCSINRDTTMAFTQALQQITGGSFCHLHNGGDDLDVNVSDDDDSMCEGYEKIEKIEYTDIIDWVSVDGATAGESADGTTAEEFLYVKPSKIRVKIVIGDLATQTVDVIVNIVNLDLKLDIGALSKSLLTAGGQVIQADCRKHYPQGISPGGIAISRGGNLMCKNVYHGSLAHWDGGKGKAEALLTSLMSLCLMQTSVNNMSSIAFPAMGTGGLSFPADVVASAMFDCVRQFDQDNPDTSIQDVTFVLYPKEMAVIKAFGAVEKKQQSDCVIKRHKIENSSQPQSPNTDSHSQLQSADFRRSVHQPVSYKLGQVTLELMKGDITKETTDVIVNSTLENLDLSKGAVSNAILKAAGRPIQDECDNTVYRTKIKQDGYVLTSPGRLQCHVIMHVKSKNKPESWRKVVSKCLEETDKLKYKSISFPALGTGGKGCDPKAVAEAITDAILGSAWSKKLKSVRLVRLVIFQLEMLNIFKSVLQAKSGQNRRSLLSVFPAFGKKTNMTDPDDSVTFVIFAHSLDSIRSATRSLNITVDEEFTDKLISEPYRELIKELKSYQVSKVMTLGEDKETKVTVIIGKGQIKLNGRSQQVMEANDAIAHYLRNIENDKHKQEMSTFMKAQWYYVIDQSRDMKKFSPEHNADIEMAYTQKKPTVDVKDKNGEAYRINFSSMTEYAMSRPQNKIRVIRSDLSPSVGVPPDWSAMKPGEDVKVVSLSQSDPEFKKISQRFLSSLNAKVGMTQQIGGMFRNMSVGQPARPIIIKINRIQNCSLYSQFLAKKKQIEQQARNRPLEHLLWHGTSDDVVKSVNYNGFDRGYCGKHGTALGPGVYFAVNASYSVTGNYCSPDSQGNRHIYLAQVLTGDPIQGSSNMKVLPKKNSKTHIHYDSSVDNTSNPGVYVIFHDSQAYPTYHIIFK